MKNISHPKPKNEKERLKTLLAYNILDTLPEQAYDDFTQLAAVIFKTPIALITLVDAQRQWFKSKVGLDISETPREDAFCAHAIMAPGEVLVINDATKDERFSSSPLVIDNPNIRFYAGAPLVTPGGEALGTICVIDRVPREITSDELEALKTLSREIVNQLELRRSIAKLEEVALAQETYVEQLQQYQRDAEKIRSELEVQSITDALTGIFNRRGLEDRLKEEFAQSSRYKFDLSLLMIDVDLFKHYNDTFGHPAGDEILQTVAKILRLDMRTYDILARYGGEEFVIILPNTNLKGALVMGERFRRAVQLAAWSKRAITISVGVAELTSEITAPHDLVVQADRALYHAKQNGRNRVSSLHDETKKT